MIGERRASRATRSASPFCLAIILRRLCGPLLVIGGGGLGLLSAGCSHTPAREPRAPADTWDAIYLDGARAGYGHMTVHEEQHAGQPLRRVEMLYHLVIKRFGQNTTQDIHCTTLETTDGHLREFTSQIGAGSEPIRFEGWIEGLRLRMRTTSSGKPETTSVAWDEQCRSPFAVELGLQAHPMQPGERRSLKTFDLTMNAVVTEELIARDYEPVQLLAGTVSLLRIDMTTRLADGQTIPQITWTDRTGAALKTHLDMLKTDTYRVTQAEALSVDPAGPVDLSADLAIPLKHPLQRGHAAQEIRYRLHLEGRDPAAVFVAGPTQQVRSLDPHTAEVTVRATRPTAAGRTSAAATDPPTAADREPNALIESDDPAVVAMAAEAAGQERDPWKLATTLEQYVNRIITKKNFSKAFDTAAQVARTREGDCTEHSVLLAALARARGLPARVAIGLVYVTGQQAFAYHMWTELNIEGQWIPMDATLGRAGIGAAHLKLGHNNLKGASAFSSFLPVIDVIGRLTIEVVEEK